ncbi:MAG: FkbM family methyltransferase [Lachnospiraceae bacterium]|nr:FkbM family methyltransferase [Lachnospiraceae bacterium]
MGNESVDFIKKARKVYFSLEDEESKEIFKKKFLYNITGENKYWLQIIMNRDIENYKKLEEIQSEKIIVYGAGNMCEASINSCKALGHTIKFICDRDKTKQGMEKFGIKIISPEELIEKHLDATVVVGTADYSEEIVEYLSAYFSDEHIIQLVSRVTLEHQLKQYLEESIMEYKDGEVFVDCGCFDFESSERLMDICDVKKIYAFEPDAQNLEKVKANVERLKCKDKVEIFNFGLWDESTSLYFNSSGDMMSKVCNDGNEEDKIEVVALDSVIKEKVTFIKMDIEGSEMKALQGGRNLIQKYKPKLAISIYHKWEDLVDIPAYIHELVPEYKLSIRHYFYSPAETVLYATI